jgi:hypothetical protein
MATVETKKIALCDPFADAKWMKETWNVLSTADAMIAKISEPELRALRTAVTQRLSPEVVKELFTHALNAEKAKGTVCEARVWRLSFGSVSAFGRALEGKEVARMSSVHGEEVGQRWGAYPQFREWALNPASTLVVLELTFPKPSAMLQRVFEEHAPSAITLCISVWNP